jgi:hypothetical protein
MMPTSFTHDGKAYEIPSLKDIPAGVIRKSRKSARDEEDRVFTILEDVLGEKSDALKALDLMSIAEFSVVIKDWTQGASLPE